ncbi:MAG: hypothetical protein AAF346_04295, partial [Pseudomonadota bacterium]
MNQQLKLHDPAIALAFHEKWSPKVLLQLGFYFCVCVSAIALIPNQIWDPDGREFVYVMGILGVWRYGWWLNHWVRAIIYERIAYPRIRARADAIWDSGWRPDRVHVLMTTFREERTTAEAV